MQKTYRFMKKNIIVLLVALISVPIIKQIADIRSNQYPYLFEYKNSFSGVVIKNRIGMAGTRQILFKDKSTFYIGSSYKSDTVKGEQLKLKRWDQKILNMFLQYGDSIFKHENSDTIFVYRNGIEYTFIDRAYRE